MKYIKLEKQSHCGKISCLNMTLKNKIKKKKGNKNLLTSRIPVGILNYN